MASTQPDQRRAAESTWFQLVSLASAAGMGAQTLTRQNLPDHLLSSHQAIDNGQAGIRVHRDHSQLILDSIRSDIGGSVALQRKEIQVRSMDALSNQRVLLLTGPPGCGKSAVAKSIVLSAQGDFECMSFRAEGICKEQHRRCATGFNNGGSTTGISGCTAEGLDPHRECRAPAGATGPGRLFRTR